MPLGPALALVAAVAAPELDEAAGAEGVAGAQQGGDVDVERAVGLGRREQQAHGADALEDAVGRGPGALLACAVAVGAVEQIQADLPRLQRHVGVHHRRRERDPRRLQRVRGRDRDAQEPAAFCCCFPQTPSSAGFPRVSGRVNCVYVHGWGDDVIYGEKGKL